MSWDETALPHEKLSEASVITGRRESRRFPKGCGERACLAEANRQSDIGHRGRGLRQQRLGALHTTAGVKSMRRDAEGLLEGPAEIVRAQANQLGERGERYLLGEMLLDIGGDDTLLPRREPAPNGRLDAGGSAGVE